MVNFKLGVDNCFALKRWPEAVDWVEIINKQLQLDIVEFDSDFLDPLFVSEDIAIRVAEYIKKIVKQKKIFLHNYFTGEMTHKVNLISHPNIEIKRNGIRWVEKAIKIATVLGAKGIGGHFDTFPSSALIDNKQYKYCMDSLINNLIYFSELAYNEGHKILMLEQMYSPYEVPYTIKQTYEILDRVNSKSKIFISPVIDVGHMCCQNYVHSPEDTNPYFWLKEFASIIEVVHLHQTMDYESCHWPFTKEYNKKGFIEPEKVLGALNVSNKKEIYLIFEIFFSLNQSDEKVVKDMIETVNYWKEYI